MLVAPQHLRMPALRARPIRPGVMMRALLSALSVFALVAPALAQAPRPDGLPILSPPSLAGLTEDNRAAYLRWTTYNLGRAIAFGPNGAQGAAWGNRDVEAAKTTALENCNRRAGGSGCTLYAVDLAIVAAGREWSPAERPPASIGIGSAMAWEIVPDARYLWRGPAAARGAIVFGHGRGGADQDNRGQQPHTWVRHFNNAGYDVFRFDRHPGTDDAARAAAWLRDGLTQLRARGYREIVMSGQSRGGWNTLQMLAHPGLIDAGISIAAAAHGSGSSMNLSGQTDQLRQIAREAASPRARVAFVQFALDPFVADNESRAQLLRDVVAPRVGAVLVIDRPDGFTGHGAGSQWQFADRFGPCLVAFVTEPAPRRSC
jgi:dienelactone hydrolase